MKMKCRNCGNEVATDSELENLITRYLNLSAEMSTIGIKMENLFVLIDRSGIFECCDKSDYVINF